MESVVALINKNVKDGFISTLWATCPDLDYLYSKEQVFNFYDEWLNTGKITKARRRAHIQTSQEDGSQKRNRKSVSHAVEPAVEPAVAPAVAPAVEPAVEPAVAPAVVRAASTDCNSDDDSSDKPQRKLVPKKKRAASVYVSNTSRAQTDVAPTVAPTVPPKKKRAPRRLSCVSTSDNASEDEFVTVENKSNQASLSESDGIKPYKPKKTRMSLPAQSSNADKRKATITDLFGDDSDGESSNADAHADAHADTASVAPADENTN